MMTKYFILTVLALSTAFASSQPTMTSLKDKIDSILSVSDGTFAVAWKDLQTGQELLLRAKENFHAASTMKTPVMIEVFKQAEEGKFSLSDSLNVINTFSSIIDGSPYTLDVGDDSEDSLYSFIGKKLSIRELLFRMITVSSNLSTNILIEKVKAANVMKTMKALGADDIQVLRGVEDQKAFDAGKNNTTTAYDLMLLFTKIASKKILSSSACDEMIDILKHQKFNEMIPGLLPKNVLVAHKTGSITGVQHDSGIVYLPDGRKYVLVVLSKNLKSAQEGIQTIAKISKLIYDSYVQ